MIAVAPPVLPGDYNNDGTIDAADYTVWRDSLGSNATLPNETASAGVIDAADFDAWKENFGSTSGGAGAAAAAPLPEPTSIALIGMGWMVVWARWRTSRSRRCQELGI